MLILACTNGIYLFLSFYWLAISRLNNQIAGWDTKFETGTKAALLHPFYPIVVAADENERIKYANFISLTSSTFLLTYDSWFDILYVATKVKYCMMP